MLVGQLFLNVVSLTINKLTIRKKINIQENVVAMAIAIAGLQRFLPASPPR